MRRLVALFGLIVALLSPATSFAQSISQPAPQSSVPVTGLLVAATKGKIATGTRAATTQDSDVVRGDYTLGPGCWTELDGLMMNWWALASATGEATNAGPLSFEVALTNPATLQTVRFTTAGANVGSVPINGTVRTDPISAKAFGLTCFPGGSPWWVTVRRTTASSTDGHPWWGTNQYLNLPDEYEYSYASATTSAAVVASTYIDAQPPLAQFAKSGTSVNQGVTTGVTWPNTSASGLSVFGGFALVGRNTAATKAFCLVGDSIGDGTNDRQTPQPSLDGSGAFARGLRDANGNVQASFIKITMPGDRAQWFVGVHALRAGLFGYCNAAEIEYSHNDGAGGRTAAQVFADNATIAGLLHAAGVNYIALTLATPYTTSTNGWIDTANQTPVSGFEPGGSFRDAYNTLATNAAANHTNNINATINVNEFIENGTTGVWLGNLSADGIHPNEAASTLMTPTLRSFYAGAPLAAGGL